MTDFLDIRAALESRVSSISGAPSASNRAWENVDFKPTVGTSWIRMTLLPGPQRPAVVGSNPILRYDGILQIDVFTPLDTGPAAADALADAVRTAFNPGRELTSNSTVVTVRWSQRLPARRDDSWYQVPVEIAWYTFLG